jgi:hypothetical protein
MHLYWLKETALEVPLPFGTRPWEYRHFDALRISGLVQSGSGIGRVYSNHGLPVDPMKLQAKSIRTHHYPIVLSQIAFGLAAIALGLLMMREAAGRMPGDYPWYGGLWIVVWLGILVLFIGIRFLYMDIFGYLKEIELQEREIAGQHLFGWKVRVTYPEITSCIQTTTVTKYGFGNPAMVIRCKRFPFRYTFNMKGHADETADRLEKAVREKMGLEGRIRE